MLCSIALVAVVKNKAPFTANADVPGMVAGKTDDTQTSAAASSGVGDVGVLSQDLGWRVVLISWESTMSISAVAGFGTAWG